MNPGPVYQGRVIVPTQEQRIALSMIDPEELLRIARHDAPLQRLFKRCGAGDAQFDGVRALSVDHLDIMACMGLGDDPRAFARRIAFRSPPWATDAAVTHSWVAEKDKVTFGTGVGVSSLAPEKGIISLTQSGGASKEPQFVGTGGWGKSSLSCITMDGVAQHFVADSLASTVTGNDKPFSVILSVEQGSTSGGINKVFWGFTNTSDSNSWHFFDQEQVGGNEIYRSRRASTSVFSAINSTFPYPTTAASTSAGYWRHVITLLFTGTQVTVRVDGIVSSISSATQDVASLTFSKFTLGAFRGATTSGYMNMKFRRLIFGTSAFSSGTYTAAEDYMRQENQMRPSPKKGMTVVCNPGAGGGQVFSFPSEPNPSFGGQQRLNLSWYYNYTVTPWGTTSSFVGPIGETLPPLTSFGPTLPPSHEFVPALSSLAVADDPQNRTWAQSSGTHLLTFNEPDAAGTTTPCISVANAIARWPTIIGMGMVTGAPAVTSAADQTTGWLHSFMTNAAAPHVDFIPIHSYISAGNFGSPTNATNGILNYINGVASLYGKPVWLSEFNGLDFTTVPWGAPTQAQFFAILQRLIPWLEANGNTERWALFQMHYPLTDPVVGTFTNMCVADDGSMPATGIGAVYADLGRI